MAAHSHGGAPNRVLVWSPRAELFQMLESSLEKRGLRALRADNSLTAALDDVRPDALIIDAAVSKDGEDAETLLKRAGHGHARG